MRPTIAAYLYPGWHQCPERDRHFQPGWSEWDLVYGARPLFDGHLQPNLPLDGRYDDSLPETTERQVGLAEEHGIGLFIHALFWSRGKRVFESALDRGFLGSTGGARFPFALMWANRMPRRVLPVKRVIGPEIDPGRLIHTDPEDFLELIRFAAGRYFSRPNYFRVKGSPYLSIFDSSFFLRQLGPERARGAVAAARRWLVDNGFGGLHLAAIDPAPEFRGMIREIGFDSVTHYVLLPEWKGAERQRYGECARRRAAQWAGFRRETSLPYHPSVSPGWDATPRAADFGAPKPKRYPWSPIVIDSSPAEFEWLLQAGWDYTVQNESDPLLFIASFNEWSEGHYLEPDRRFEYGWLQAVRKVARG